MENFSTFYNLLTTDSYAQKHHNNYNILYKTYPMKVSKGVRRRTSKYLGDGSMQHPNQREHCWKLHIHVATQHPEG